MSSRRTAGSAATRRTAGRRIRDKHAAATGVSEGIVKVGAASRSEIEGDLAYVIVPTVYTYKEHGKSIMEEGGR